MERGISVQGYNGDLLYEPWEINSENGKPFTSFAPYWKKCLDMSVESVMLPPPWRLMPLTAGKKPRAGPEILDPVGDLVKISTTFFKKNLGTYI